MHLCKHFGSQSILPVHVDTLEVLRLEHKDEPHEGDGCMDDLATAWHYYDAYDYIELLPLHLRV